MKRNNLSILAIIAIIFVLLGAAAYAIDSNNNSNAELNFITVWQDACCYIHTTGTVITNNTTDTGAYVVLNISNDEIFIVCENVTGKQINETLNTFVYVNNTPCYYYTLYDGCTYCVYVNASTNPAYKTTEFLQSILVVSLLEDNEDEESVEINLGGLSLAPHIGFNLGGIELGNFEMGDINIQKLTVYGNYSGGNYTIEDLVFHGYEVKNFTLPELIAKLLEHYTVEELLKMAYDLDYDSSVPIPLLNDFEYGNNDTEYDIDLILVNYTDDSVEFEYHIVPFKEGTLQFTIDGQNYPFEINKDSGKIHINCHVNPDSHVSVKFIPKN